MSNDKDNNNDKDSDSGSKYDRAAGTKGTDDPKYDKDLESRQDQSNRDRQEQQGEEED
ncbi:MAG: hypothetical protein AB7D02_02780 [Candidatus Paceibacterota bacterium]|jgi:hypothetical protein